MIEVLDGPGPGAEQYVSELERRGLSFSVTGLPNFLFQINVNRCLLRWGMRLGLKRSTRLVLNEDGNAHHLTYGICANLKDDFGYIHFDRHSDYGTTDVRTVCMGGFVARLLEDTRAVDSLFIGCDQPLGHKTIPSDDYSKLVDLIPTLNELPAQVYVSVDLDVLKPEEFSSGYTTGTMTRAQLTRALEQIIANKEVLGIDICGYSGEDISSLDYVVDLALRFSQ